jgi:hypothetical protein
MKGNSEVLVKGQKWESVGCTWPVPLRLRLLSLTPLAGSIRSEFWCSGRMQFESEEESIDSESVVSVLDLEV